MYMEYSLSAAVDRSLLHPWSSDVYERCLSLMSTNFRVLSDETCYEGQCSRLLAVIHFLRNTIDIERFRVQNLPHACRRSRAQPPGLTASPIGLQSKQGEVGGVCKVCYVSAPMDLRLQ